MLPTAPTAEPPDRHAADKSPVESAVWRNPAAVAWHQGALALFVLLAASELAVNVLGLRGTALAAGVGAALFPAAAFSSLCGLARRLPVQNVVMIGFGVAGLATAALAFAASSGFPFGLIQFRDQLGFKLLRYVPWPLPFLWITVVVTCRGMARLLLRPFRRTTYYGFWVIGAASVLAVGFDLALEPYAVSVRDWWGWDPTTRSLRWHEAPWVNFPGWLVSHALILAFVTPWMLNKQAVRQPVDLHPLALWSILMALMAAGSLTRGLWGAALVTTIVGGGAAAAAFRVGRGGGPSMLA